MSSETLYLMFFVALAGSVQGTVGFGFGIVAMSTLPLWMDVKEAVPLVAALGLLVNIAMTWNLRAHLTWSRLAPLILGGVIGVPIGVTLFVSLNPDLLLIGLGMALIGVAIQQKRTAPGEGTGLTPAWGGVAGLASGVLGGAFNTGGPPVVLYVGMQRWTKEHTVATLQGFLLFSCVLQITLFVLRGTLGGAELQRAGLLVLPTLVGVLVGQQLFHRIDQDRFRSLLLTAIALLGASLLYKGASAVLG